MRGYKNTLEIIRDQPSHTTEQRVAEMGVRPGNVSELDVNCVWRWWLPSLKPPDVSQQVRTICGLSDF